MFYQVLKFLRDVGITLLAFESVELRMRNYEIFLFSYTDLYEVIRRATDNLNIIIQKGYYSIFFFYPQIGVSKTYLNLKLNKVLIIFQLIFMDNYMLGCFYKTKTIAITDFICISSPFKMFFAVFGIHEKTINELF